MNEETKAQAKYLAELAIVNVATSLQMLVRNRPDLAKHFSAQAEKQVVRAKLLDGEVGIKEVVQELGGKG